MAEMLEFCANQPVIAKAIFVEVHAAGERSLAQRRDLMERLSHALDSARREIPSRQAPPPVTSTFMVGAIDTLVCAKLMDGDAARAPEMLPGLLHFVVMQYFGEDAAWEEMTAASVAPGSRGATRPRRCPAERRLYSGMLPCLRFGWATRLDCSMRSALTSFGRVSRGSITSSM